MSAASRRYFGLDGMRGFAALVVVLNHVGMHQANAFAPHGYLAVDFFFALSGFVIALAYEDKLLRGQKLGDFIVTRLIRLYPLFAVGLLLGLGKIMLQIAMEDEGAMSLAALVEAVVTGLVMLPGNVGPASGLFPANQTIFPLNTPAWSLFFEMAINILFAAFLFRLRQRWLMATVALSGILFAYGIVTVGDKSIGVQPHAFLWGFLRVTFSFMLGVLLFRLLRTTPRRTTAWAHVPTVLLVLLLMAKPAAWEMPYFELGVIYAALPIILIAGIVWEVPERHRPLYGFMGDISYPVYIMHFPLLMVAMAAWERLHLPVVPMAALFTIGMVLFAHLLGRYFDVPVRKWLMGKWRAHMRKVDAAPAEVPTAADAGKAFS